MDGWVGILAVAGGLGLAYGVTILGLHVVLSVMPRKNSGRKSAHGDTPRAA
jgi:hypothetical protein